MNNEMHEYAHELKSAYRNGVIDRRDFIKWSAILGLSIPLLDLSQAQAARPAVRRGGTLTVVEASPTTIEPPLLVDGPGIDIVSQVGEYLIYVGNDLIPRPMLATSWTPSDAAKTWTVKLRQGIKFNNGQLMTADDVVATFKRLVGPAAVSSAQGILAFLKPEGVRKVDQFTVAFHLTRAIADLPYYISNVTYQSVILPASYPGHFAKNAIGTGPFLLKEYVPQQRATYVRNPSYWQPGLPYLDGVKLLLGFSLDARTTALLGGSADMENTTDGSSLPLLRANPSVRVWGAHSSFYNGIFMRTDKAPFTDKRVRQAMALCLNRPDIVKSVLQSEGIIGNDNVVAPIFPLYTPITQRAQDYTKAKALLSAAGMPNGFSATLTTASDTADLLSLAQVAQQMWKQVGINIKLAPEPGSVYYNTDWLGKPLTITEWAHRPTPSQLLDVAYRSTGTWNASHWSNATFDRLTAELDAELDFTKRKAIVKQIELIMNDEVPSIVSHFTSALRSTRSNVQGVGAALSPGLFLNKAYFSA